MSISVSRDLNNEFGYDPMGHLRVNFKLSVEKGLSAEDTKDLLSRVGQFLSNFEAETGLLTRDEFDGFAYVINMREGFDRTALTSVEDIDAIEVRVGYAQKFQTEFNAEFSANEL